ncbi:MAG: hypothetical protein ACOYN7_04535 [Candidatus Nanopelagicales bacterium]
MKWTGIRAVTLAAVVALGAGTIGAAPAQAADLGSTVVTADIPFLVFSPNPLNGAVGDSFTVTNNSGQTIQPDSGGSTGVISHESGGSSCFGSHSCYVSNGSSEVFYIKTLGTITFTGGGNTGPLRLEAGGGGVTDPALVYPTASINANGGTCTGPTQYIKYQGQNAANGIFTAPTADSCTRTNFSLAGWARSATGSVEWQPGSTVTIGDEGFTLFAVWRPNGIEIVYDANVGLETQCLSSNGTNLTTAAERRTTPTVVPASSAAAAQAPCTPPGHTLNGWSLTGAGPLTLVKGAALPASFTGTSQTLYAKWEPDRFDLSVQADSLIVNSAEPLRPLRICAGVSQLVTFTATKNGVAAAGQIIDVEIARTGAPPITQQKLTTDASGRVQVNFELDRNYTPQVVSGSFANQVARLIFFERDSLQCVETITITGARTTVDGKPGIMVEGVTTGFAAGAVVKPYFRFPGETSYTESSARPVVDASGRFTWTRKTGKKLYAFMVSEDGSVQSNRVIIPAN